MTHSRAWRGIRGRDLLHGVCLLMVMSLFPLHVEYVMAAGQAMDVSSDGDSPSDVSEPSALLGEARGISLKEASGDEVEASLPDETWQAQASLARFFHGNEQQSFLALRQSEATHTLHIPLPYRVRIEHLTLHLEYNNSIALLRGRSQMRIRWNGDTLTQIPLDPELFEGSVDIEVPGRLMHGGDNLLTIDVSQHYRAECEDPGSPELWTNINMMRSRISASGRWKTVPSRLDAFERWLSPVGWNGLSLVVASLGKSEEHLHAGTMLAQLLGSKTQQALHIEAIPWLRALRQIPPHRDAVLFGTYEEAQGIAGLHPKDFKSLGHIALLPRPGAPDRFLLLVLARKASDISKVVSALVWSSLPLQAGPEMDIEDIQPAPSSPYAARKATMAGRTYRFADLEYRTRSLRGLHDHVRLQMWIPPDLFAENHSLVELNLHFSYGAALRPDSVLNIYHNTLFLQSISLGDPQGLQVRDYRITIPMYAFRPGLNEFIFESRMHANTGSNCTTGNTDNLLMTLYEDSTVSIPDAPHFVAMPDLYYTLNTGFPYLGSQGADQVIAVDSITPDTLSAAWTLAAKIGQLKGDAVDSLTVTTQAEAHANVILLSNIVQTDDRIWEHAPIDLRTAGMINHPTLRDPSSLGRKTQSRMEELYRLFWHSESKKGRPEFYQARIRHSAQILKNSGILMQMETPWRSGGTLTLLLADDTHQLRHAVSDLIRIWPRLKDAHGDTLFWGRPDEKQGLDYNILDLDPHRYHIGSIGFWQRIHYFAIQYPVFLLLVTFSLLVVVTLLTRWLLIAYRRRTHADIEP